MRAFKSTLEDLEEKRSIHSFHSLHSLRSSRSHQGHRPLSEELTYSSNEANTKSSPEQNGSYTNMALSIQENNLEKKHSKCNTHSKSRSAENVSLLDSTTTTPAVIVEGASPSQSRTFSSSDIASSLHETSI